MRQRNNKSSVLKKESAAKHIARNRVHTQSFDQGNQRPEIQNQLNIMELADNSVQIKQTAQLQVMADDANGVNSVDHFNQPNLTGMPDQLKSGIEALSGYAMDDVKVHYNSNKPAQLQAHAYAQGTEIYLGPGQEKHLPREAWHVVQQKQGRVQPTVQMKGNAVNDEIGLEQEADEMGSKAMNQSKIRGNALIKTALSTDRIIQGQFTPQTRKHLGFADDAADWLDETIGNVVFARYNGMNYTKADGDNTGSIKHYVPYNWIMKNIADKLVIGHPRHTVIAKLATALGNLGMDLPGSYPENPADFDALIRDSVYMICDWEENLFKHSVSSGDGGGTQLDVPDNAAVLARVEAARIALGPLALKALA